MNKEYDDAEGRVKDAEADLADYLQQIRRQLAAGKDLCYVTVNKDANLLEIPQVSCLRARWLLIRKLQSYRLLCSKHIASV